MCWHILPVPPVLGQRLACRLTRGACIKLELSSTNFKLAKLYVLSTNMNVSSDSRLFPYPPSPRARISRSSRVGRPGKELCMLCIIE